MTAETRGALSLTPGKANTLATIPGPDRAIAHSRGMPSGMVARSAEVPA